MRNCQNHGKTTVETVQRVCPTVINMEHRKNAE